METISDDETELIRIKKENKELRKKLHKTSSYVDRFNMIVENSHGWIWEVDTNGVYTYASPQVKDVLGYEIDEVIGKTPFDFMSEDEAKRIVEVYGEIAFNQKAFSKLINVCIRKDGSQIHTETSAKPLYDEDGIFLGYRGIDFDRTREISKELDLETKTLSLEQALKEQHTLLLNVINSISDFIFYKDSNLHYIGCNQAFCDFVGLPMESIIGKTDFELFDKDDAEQFRSIDTMVFKNMSSHSNYEWVTHSDGRKLSLLTEKSPLIDKNDALVGMVGISKDYTVNHNLENQLAQQKEAFEAIFEYSSDGILLIENGKFTSCNQSIVEMMGASSKKEFLNRHPSELSPKFQPDGRESFEKAEEMMNICLKNGRNQFEWVHTRKNGEDFWTEVLLTRLNINNKLTIHVSWRDISDRKKLENDLEASNAKYKELISKLDTTVKDQSAQLIKQSRMAQIGELLSMIAHQWRQPLGSIASVAINVKVKLSLLDLEEYNKESAQTLNNFVDQRMDEIESYVKSLSTTIDDFRTLYKPDKVMEYNSIIKPIHHALMLMKLSFNDNSITVKESHNVETPILMHNNEIMQVIMNLLKNAEDNFLENNVKNPPIYIESSKVDDKIIIDIKDNGGGIPKFLQEKIFEPYFSTKTEKNGTGLGLYMCKIIIEDHHNGKLNVFNKDDGACFSIELPMK